MSEPLGATSLDWYALDFELGLGKHLLPCVPYSPDVKCIEGSTLEGKVGKIPSAFNAEGLAHGLKEWNKREILGDEIQVWSRDRRLNICVRTGEISGVYAIDVDVDDPRLSASISDMLFIGGQQWGEFDACPRRTRSNSNKFLLPFRMDEGCKKRIITVVPADKDKKTKPQRIELLANGQQFVAAGTHSSGVRYEWPGGLPTKLPTLSITQLNTIWSMLATAFEANVSPTPSPDTSTTSEPKPTGDTLTEISEDDWTSLRQALRFMLDKVPDNDTWSHIGYALLSLKHSRPAEVLWHEFSAKAVGYEPGASQQWWDAHASQEPISDYRHILKLARGLGWAQSSAPDIFTPVNQPVGEDGVETPPPPPLPDKPIVQVSDAALVENIAQMSAIIRPLAYTQGNILARLGRDNLDDDIRRNSDQLVLIPITNGWARVQFTDMAQFQRYDGRSESWKNSSCPAELANVWMGQGDYPQLRPLDAIARAPFVRADGSICDVPGYDPRSRALYVPSMVFPGVPESPTRDAAMDALARLLSPFDEFPWYTNSSRSAFAAHIFTEAARLAVDRVPMFWYTAPDAGTGKTMLSEAASTIVHGSEPAVRPWVTDGDELRKTLFASLLAGDRSIAFDNVPTGYKARAPELCAFLTSAIWKDRKLGVSETHAVPNKAVVSASGNNVTPVADLARRCLVVRLDANSERMRERRFKIPNLRGYLLQQRAPLLVDALTVIKAYHLQPSLDITPLPSFEQWSKVVREPLIWLGLPDPCETQKSETDDETGSIGEIFTKLVSHFGDRSFTCVDVARLAGGILDADGQLSSLMMTHGCQEPSSPQKVGYWLRTLRDKNANGLKLVNVGRVTAGAAWQLRRLNGDLA